MGFFSNLRAKIDASRAEDDVLATSNLEGEGLSSQPTPGRTIAGAVQETKDDAMAKNEPQQIFPR
jgi:hypothetical protein